MPHRLPLRILRVPSLLAILLLLAACGSAGRTQSGLIKRINPPSASVEGLALTASGPVRITLRLQNFSTVPTRYGVVDAAIAIDGRPAGRLLLDAGIEVPGLSSDVVWGNLDLDPAARARLQGATGAIAYRLQGVITTTEPDDRYDFTFDSRLNPVPGRPGEFR